MKKAPIKAAQPNALSPLVLESVRVIALEMTEVDKAAKLTNLSNTLSITHKVDQEATTCTVVLDVNVKHGAPEVGLYAVRAKVEGKYGFQPGVPDELRKKLIPMHPAVNLLGFLRGMVFQATAILPCGSISLPLFDLTRMIVPRELEQMPTAKATAAPKKSVTKEPSKAKAGLSKR